MELVIVRHARPERVEGVDGGADPALNDAGQRQAAEVGAFLASERIDHIASSPLLRARQTAAPLAMQLGLEIEIVEGLAEVDKGTPSYIPTEELKAEGGQQWDELSADPFAAFGIDAAEFAATVVAAMDHLVATNPGRSVAVFCHGMVTSVYLQHVLGLDYGYHLTPEYTGISRVTASTSKSLRTVRSVNETAHVRGMLPDRL